MKRKKRGKPQFRYQKKTRRKKIP